MFIYFVAVFTSNSCVRCGDSNTSFLHTKHYTYYNNILIYYEHGEQQKYILPVAKSFTHSYSHISSSSSSGAAGFAIKTKNKQKEKALLVLNYYSVLLWLHWDYVRKSIYFGFILNSYA